MHRGGIYPVGVDYVKEELLHGMLRLETPTDEELAEDGGGFPAGLNRPLSVAGPSIR